MISNEITDLLPNPDKKGYVDVYVDGNVFITVTEDVVVESELYVGRVMDAETLKTVQFDVVYTKARSKAFEYLSYGDMTWDTLHEKLINFGFSDLMAETVCDLLEQDGYIDDRRYAEKYARHLAENKYYGPYRIKYELTRKGVSEQLADEVIENLDVNYEDSVIALIESKYRCSLSDRKAVARLAAALNRYGYDYDMVGFAIAYLEENYD